MTMLNVNFRARFLIIVSRYCCSMINSRVDFSTSSTNNSWLCRVHFFFKLYTLMNKIISHFFIFLFEASIFFFLFFFADLTCFLIDVWITDHFEFILKKRDDTQSSQLTHFWLWESQLYIRVKWDRVVSRCRFMKWFAVSLSDDVASIVTDQIDDK